MGEANNTRLTRAAHPRAAAAHGSHHLAHLAEIHAAPLHSLRRLLRLLTVRVHMCACVCVLPRCHLGAISVPAP